MAVKIGAKIGIEGEAQYRSAVNSIISTTRKLKNEFNEIESAIGNNKTISDVAKQRENLNEQLKETTKILEKQQEVLKKAQDYNASQDSMGLDWQPKDYIDEGKILQYETNLINTQTEVNKLKRQIEDLPTSINLVSTAFKNATSEWGEALKGVGTFMSKYVTLPLSIAGGVSLKAFSDWETAFTGVTKTVEGTPEQLEKVAKGLTDIALSSASSREDIAGVAEVAGQLGIETDNVVDFTRVMVMLGDSTNLAADEAATAMARIINITGDSQSVDNVEKLGNSIVWLGNNFATSESEILHMTNRLAAGGKLAGLTTQDILGLATAMSSVGITAEAGGTAMTQTLSKIEKEFANFSSGAESKLPRIAEIAGMSADEFARSWKQEPIKAVQAFISGLGNLDEEAESTVLILDELDMAGIRQGNMLKSLALASGVLKDAVEGSNNAYSNSTALFDEASKKYETFAAQTSQLKEAFKILGSTLGKTIGNLLLPAVEGLTVLVTKLAEGWAKLPEPLQNFIIILGGLVAAIGPVLVAVGSFLIFISKIKAVLGAVEMTLGAFALTTIGPFVGGILIAATAITTLITIIKNWDNIVAFSKKVIAAFGEAFKIFGELVVEIFKFVSDVIRSKLSEIRDNVVNKLTEAKENGINLFNQFKDYATNIFSNLGASISQKAWEIRNSVVNGIGSAIDWIRSLPGQAWSWGSDLIGNFTSGITSRIGSVIDAVANVAGRVRSYLHFSEPDVGPLSDFSTYMPDMMKLMAKGINDNAYLVEDALGNVTGMMASNLEAKENSVNYGGVVINLNVPQGADGKMLVDEIETELANRSLRRKAVFN